MIPIFVIFGFKHFVTNTSKSQSMDNGYVLVMSEWDDGAAHMLWLDSNYPPDADPSKPGVSDFAHLLSELRIFPQLCNYSLHADPSKPGVIVVVVTQSGHSQTLQKLTLFCFR